jgi:hypothetical protein
VIVVPDAGPLIYLAAPAKSSSSALFYAEVVVPRIVVEEVVIAGVGLPGADAVAGAT